MFNLRWVQKSAAISVMTAMLFTSFTWSAAAHPVSAASFPALSTVGSERAVSEDRKINFNDNWRFQRETNGSIAGAQAPAFDDSAWRELKLPHDWSIELDFNPNSPATHEGGFLDGGIGWYRKTFKLPESMAGKSISIDFDGVYMNSSTYLNGQLLGTYPYGYNAFSYDISDLVYTDGRENVIAVKVNNTQPSSRWYSGSGIYRNVYLTVTNPVHVARYGTFVTTPNLEDAYAEGRADVSIQTKVANDSGQPATIKVKSTIYDEAGIAVSSVESAAKTAAPDAVAVFEDEGVIDNPTLWSLDNPYRYTLVSEVIAQGEIVDTYETRFGVRYFEFDNNEGFSLNGEYMKLHGVSMHHDLGALGAAINDRAVERQMQIMKDMGVNAIRSTHNPASPELIEVANELGLLVIEEAFDAWNVSKKTYDYARFFSVWSDRYQSTWAEHDIKEMVDRGKNEPSIIMWSLGNEVYDATSASGGPTAVKLNQWVKEVDTTRPTTIGQNAIRGDGVNMSLPSANIKAVMDAVDVVGLNYAENNYAGYHETYPNWILYGSETSSATRSRGVYTHPYEYNRMRTYADYQQSSYDNDVVGWGNTAEVSWKRDRDLKHIAGQFIWTGFDYIGEPTPYYNSYPAKSSYFGAVDTAGFPKDIYYYYQSQWTAEPMVHLLPHWNWTAGTSVRVLAYTNAQKVELFLNGKSLGERSYVNQTTSFGVPYKETTDGKTYLEWAVPFQAGTLEAVAKNEAGEIIARDQVVTAGAPAAVRLTADRHVMTADGEDLSFITADIVDSEGNIVPTADHLIQFTLSGGELAGVDNGNAASVERFKDTKRKAFNGKALAIIRSDEEAGEMQITAKVSGLLGDSAKVFKVSGDENGQPEAIGFAVVEVATEVAQAPEFPASVDVYYSDSSTATKKVAWDAIESAQYAKIGQFTVEGTVEGISKKAAAVVTVTGVAAVKAQAVVTKVGVIPTLPAQVSLLYSDGREKDAAVVWDAIREEQVAVAGSFIVEGSVAETSIRAKATVRVTGEFERENLMLRQPGSTYPKLEATFTAPADNLNHINDGIKSYTDNPKNRWTNWTRTPRDGGDAITIDFGKAYAINNLHLYVFTDSGTVVPSAVTVQYWNGSSWANVSNQTNPVPYTKQLNEIKFDTVKTDKLKFHLKASQAGKFSALTEVEVYAEKFAVGTTARLSGIHVNDEALADFDAGKDEYAITLPYGSELPEIEAFGADGAVATIVPAHSIPGAARIVVTSEDGLAEPEYVIRMNMEEPKLLSAELKAERTDLVEDDTVDLKVIGLLESGESIDLTASNPTYAFDPGIIKIENGKLYALSEGEAKVTATVVYKGITVKTPAFTVTITPNTAEKVIERLEPVTVVVDRGTAPILPTAVLAHYNTGLPKEVPVAWEPIDPAQYGKLGEFTVLGSVEGTTLKASAKVVVKGILAVDNISMAVLRNRTPNLPDRVTAYFSDGTEEQLAVHWEEWPEGSLGTVGTFVVTGTVEGTLLIAKASIRVTDQVGSERNIARAKEGYDYPKAEATFTNNGPASLDRIEAVNDGVVSYGDAPHNRWTNWQRTPRSGDSVSITFGDFGPVEHVVDNMDIHWFGDSGTSYPASFKIQYKSGDNWLDVTHMQSSPPSPTLGEANRYTFDPVRTSALRVDMTAQAGKSLAITEINVFTKTAAASSEPAIADIRLDGGSIIDGFVPSGSHYDYEARIQSMDDIPEITASGEDNTSITIVPAVTAPATAKVIAKSEDGLKTVEYNIHFILDDDGTPEQTKMTLDGPASVQAEQSFAVDLGVQQVTKPVQALDVRIAYDADKFEFVRAESKLEHVKIVSAEADGAGKLKLIVASLGAQHAIHGDGAFVELEWLAKETEEETSGTIGTTEALVGFADGSESNIALASHAVLVTPSLVPADPDVNGDNKISIGDLSIVAAHYGKTKDSPDWSVAKRADITGDGKVDILDLAELASKLLQE
ncbi:Ig-like domain-containing protein [Paenibacillus sp. LHD-117]|uniref:Ig-like domain-containing protein n=1 Tax=Paenibacillus sp. LHD-117 TaxID=3071412 RepID=UPI0027DFAF60|nr:Ig-like domain-containing protein [Paenibacillus sp. LHD-117]MDQ6422163.1 Ig-like domain-containing protein [Paenibacillus sp. LHD-117]